MSSGQQYERDYVESEQGKIDDEALRLVGRALEGSHYYGSDYGKRSINHNLGGSLFVRTHLYVTWSLRGSAEEIRQKLTLIDAEVARWKQMGIEPGMSAKAIVALLGDK